tara:strand:- start:304 stop:1809 length:1506 start_codon:yes stop_codon:yes gene_type:complete
MADKTYTVTVASGSLYGGGTGSVFYLDGARNSTGPGTVSWVSNSTIRFDQSDNTNDGHPLFFADSSANPTGTIKSTGVTYYLDGSSDSSAYSNLTSFNAATTRYIEITPNAETDFFYFCYIHGIGMGGQIDITQDTWGALPWSRGNYNAQNDTTPIPSTVTITPVLGTATTTEEVNVGWGARTWGFTDWGAAGNLVTGQTMTIGNNFAGVNVTATVGIGWGRGRWNEQVWGEPNEAGSVTGQAMSLGLGSETVTAEVNAGWGRKTWNASAWGISGTLLANGIAITSAVASVTATAEVNVGWGRSTWGAQVWGNPNEAGAPTGIVMASSLGSLTIIEEINEGWGRLAWGNADWGEPAGETVQATGFGLVSKVNEKDVGWNNLSWGSQTWGFTTTSVIDVISSAELTGQSMTMSIGNEAGFTDFKITATGIAVTSALGSTTQEFRYSVSGVSGTFAIGVEVAGVNAEAVLTGIALTTNIGNISATGFVEIDPNVNQVWTEIAA